MVDSHVQASPGPRGISQLISQFCQFPYFVVMNGPEVTRAVGVWPPSSSLLVSRSQEVLQASRSVPAILPSLGLMLPPQQAPVQLRSDRIRLRTKNTCPKTRMWERALQTPRSVLMQRFNNSLRLLNGHIYNCKRSLRPLRTAGRPILLKTATSPISWRFNPE